MGSSFGWNSKEELVEYLTKPWDYGEGIEARYVNAKVVGSRLYSIFEKVEVATGKMVERYITVALLMKRGDWGYKGMCEFMGPYYYDCPLSLLKACPEIVGPQAGSADAAEWREKVRTYHITQAERRGRVYAPGQRYALPGRSIPHVTLTVVQPKRMLGEYNGTVYRVGKGMLGELLT